MPPPPLYTASALSAPQGLALEADLRFAKECTKVVYNFKHHVEQLERVYRLMHQSALCYGWDYNAAINTSNDMCIGTVLRAFHKCVKKTIWQQSKLFVCPWTLHALSFNYARCLRLQMQLFYTGTQWDTSSFYWKGGCWPSSISPVPPAGCSVVRCLGTGELLTN